MSDEAAARTIGPLTITFDPGVTVTKWTTIWQQRHPEAPLRVVAAGADAADTPPVENGAETPSEVFFVRLPVDETGLNLIALYRETPVVIVSREHPVAAFDEVSVGDLADEHLLQPTGAVPEWDAVATEVREGSRLPLRGIQSLSDAVEQVAAGIGIVIVPQAIARMNSRKDVVFRPVTGVAETQVSLAWRQGDDSGAIDEFIGIVRGRSASSSRSAATGAGAGAVSSGSGSGGGAGGGAASTRKLGPVAKAKAKAKAAREAEDRASGKKAPAPRVRQKTQSKAQSDRANAAQARRRKFGSSGSR